MPRAKSGMKICTKCKIVKPISEYHKNKYTSDGLIGVCKICAREKRISKESKEKEKLRETTGKYKQRKVRYANTEKGKLYFSKEAHRYITRLYGRKIEHTLTIDEWKSILEGQCNRCAICNVDFDFMITPEKDCIIPMSKGGALTFDNTQALCKHCNSVKRTKIYSGLGNRWRKSITNEVRE